jgi:hypothetical protein
MGRACVCSANGWRRPLPVAGHRHGTGFSDARAAIDVTGRHRLAHARPCPPSGTGRLMSMLTPDSLDPIRNDATACAGVHHVASFARRSGAVAAHAARGAGRDHAFANVDRDAAAQPLRTSLTDLLGRLSGRSTLAGDPLCPEPLEGPGPLPRRRPLRTGHKYRRARHAPRRSRPKERPFLPGRTAAESIGRWSRR